MYPKLKTDNNIIVYETKNDRLKLKNIISEFGISF